MPLHLQVIIGFVGGLVTGLLVGEPATALQPVADLFVQLLRMIVAPLIFVTLALALIGSGGRAVGRIGARAVAYNLTTLGFALAVGIGAAVWLGPGRGVGAEAVQALGEGFAAPERAGEARTALDILLGIVPTNVVGAFVEGDVLQILFLAIVFGLAVNAVGSDRLRPLWKCCGPFTTSSTGWWAGWFGSRPSACSPSSPPWWGGPEWAFWARSPGMWW